MRQVEIESRSKPDENGIVWRTLACGHVQQQASGTGPKYVGWALCKTCVDPKPRIGTLTKAIAAKKAHQAEQEPVRELPFKERFAWLDEPVPSLQDSLTQHHQAEPKPETGDRQNQAGRNRAGGVR